MEHRVGVDLSPFRYLICAVLSCILHSVIWLQPSAQPAFAMNTTDTPQTMTLKFVTPPPAPPAKVESLPQKKSVKKELAKKEPIKEKVEPKPKLAPKPKAKTVTTQQEQPKPNSDTQKEPQVTKSQEQEPLPNAIPKEAGKPIMVEKPSFRVKPTPPVYPRIAKHKGQQGVVMIEVWLDEQGRQIKREIAESSGFETLDQAAIAAVEKWQFNGHSINGQIIASRLKVPVRFELN